MSAVLEHALDYLVALAAHWRHTGGLDAAICTAWTALAVTLAVITARSSTDSRAATDPTDTDDTHSGDTAPPQRRRPDVRTPR